MDTTYDYTKSELALCYDLLKEGNPTLPLTAAQLSFGLPTAVNPSQYGGRDTSILATVQNSDKYRGSATYYYTRVPMRQLLAQCMSTPYITVGRKATLVENLPYINAALGINLEAASVEDFELAEKSVSTTTFTKVRVLANPRSRVYKDGVSLYLKQNTALS